MLVTTIKGTEVYLYMFILSKDNKKMTSPNKEINDHLFIARWTILVWHHGEDQC